MNYPLTKIDGLTATAAAKLKAAGIRTTAKFLESASSQKGRKALAATTGIGEAQLLAWVNRADCLRVKGMGTATTGLLNAAGVTTVRELTFRNPERLAQAMSEANSRLKLARINPTPKSVGQLIERAKKLPIKISY